MQYVKNLLVMAVVGSFIGIATPAFANEEQPGGDTKSGEEPNTSCEHRGAEWQDPKIVNSGSPQCPSTTFELTIGANGVGGQVTVKWNGCPAYVDVRPGHGKLVQKLNHNPVGPQKLNWTRQEYTPDCGGWFSSPSCKAKGGPKDLDTTVNHWEDEGCIPVMGH